MMKSFRTLLAAITLSATAIAAQATVINFDAGLDTSNAPYAPFFMTHGDKLVQGEYVVGTYSTKVGAQPGDLVGALVDGSDLAGTCFSVVCPSNNSTQFLAMLNDGLPSLSRLDGGSFRISSFDAGFIAADGATVPNIAMLIRVIGFTGALGDIPIAQEDVLLFGPTNGVLSFSTFNLSSTFSGQDYTFVDFYGYACNSGGTCSRGLDIAQFGIDNITTATVPEPSSMALLG